MTHPVWPSRRRACTLHGSQPPACDSAVTAPVPTELFVPETPLPLGIRGDTLRFEYRVDSERITTPKTR